jgi:hypothetical protein
MKLSAEQIDTGRQRFLDAHPQIKAQVLSAPQSVADALGVQLAEVHNTDTDQAIAEMARQAGEDANDFFLRFVLDNEAERQKWIQARREATERALGLVWDDTAEK